MAARPRMPTALPTEQADLVRATPSRDRNGAEGGRSLEAGGVVSVLTRALILMVLSQSGCHGSAQVTNCLLSHWSGWELCLPTVPEPGWTDYTGTRTDRAPGQRRGTYV